MPKATLGALASGPGPGLDDKARCTHRGSMSATIKPIAIDRLALSDQVATAWETFPGGPGGSPEDNLRLIRMELEILTKRKLQRPSEADAIDRLMERYRAIGAQIRQQTN